MSLKYIQNLTLNTAENILVGATSITLAGFTDIYGNVLTMADFGSLGYGTIEPNTNQAESFTFTGVTANADADSTFTLTGVKTTLAKSPYTQTSGLTRKHISYSQVVITNNAAFIDTFPNKLNDEVITSKWEVPTPTLDQEIVNKDYVDGQTKNDTVDATTTVKGHVTLSTAPVSATDPIVVGLNDKRIPTTTQAEALAGSSGTPSGANKFVTEEDTSFTGTVKLTGNQTIAGVKTFTSIPISSAGVPTTDNQLATKGYVDSK